MKVNMVGFIMISLSEFIKHISENYFVEVCNGNVELIPIEEDD